jgi:hypothetical protein
MLKFGVMIAAMIAVPASAQTTTCRYVVANAPQYGVTCDTNNGYQAPRPARLPNMGLILNNNVADQNAIMVQRRAQQQAYEYQQQSLELQRRELALRERELKLREAGSQ